MDKKKIRRTDNVLYEVSGDLITEIMILRRSASTCWRCWPSSGMKESLIRQGKRTQPIVELSIYRYFH
jgi:hypothetical protein